MQKTGNGAKARVILADDHELLRSGVRMLLEVAGGAEVIAEASDGAELVQLVGNLEPDIVFTDVSMPGMDGLEAIQRISQAQPSVRCVVISMYDSPEVVRRAAASGAAGYLMKNASAQELRVAIEQVMARGTYYSPAVASLLLKGSAPGPTELLTGRQLEILKLVAGGQSTKEIAYQLGLSSKTVDVHRSRIMERLGISDVASLTRYAIRHGLVSA